MSVKNQYAVSGDGCFSFLQFYWMYIYIYMNILLSPIFIVSEYFYYFQYLQSLTINQLLIKNSSLY